MADLATYLDSPIWYSLTGPQAHLAEGDDEARCYPDGVSGGAAVHTEDVDAYEHLARLISPGRYIGLFGSAPPLSGRWRLTHSFPALQMICERPIAAPVEQAGTVVPLTPADVPAMLQLVALAQPGPFLPRSIELGPFASVQDEGHLVAMAGVRLHVPGAREISTVCTHPDYRRRGYASLLVRTLAHAIQQAGDVPFLHVAPDHQEVIALYESLGFVRRADLLIVEVQHL